MNHLQTETIPGVGPNGGQLGALQEGFAKLNRLEQAQTVNLSVVKKNIGELMSLYRRKQEASEDYAAETKAIAEKAGLMPAVVRKYVKACAGDKFDEALREAEQLAMVFDSEV